MDEALRFVFVVMLTGYIMAIPITLMLIHRR